MSDLTNKQAIVPSVPALMAVLALGVCLALQTNVAQAQSKPPAPTVTMTTRPTPPRAGQTTFTVTVKSPEGKPVTGAAVTVELVMAAMPSMNMPEMRNKITLKPAADPKEAAAGAYTGEGQIMMAGQWSAAVLVKVAGKDYAESKSTVVAK